MENKSCSAGTNNKLNWFGQIFGQIFWNLRNQTQIYKILKAKLKFDRSFIFVWTTRLMGVVFREGYRHEHTQGWTQNYVQICTLFPKCSNIIDIQK